LEVSDLARAAEFFTNVWNLSLVAERNGSVFLRGTGPYHHIIVLHEAENQTAVRRIVFDARDRGAVDSFYGRP
jgi:catechol-2,3-dioxygenase